MSLDAISSVASGSSPSLAQNLTRQTMDSVLSGEANSGTQYGIPLVQVFPKSQVSDVANFSRFISEGMSNGFISTARQDFIAALSSDANPRDAMVSSMIYGQCIALTAVVKTCVNKFAEGLNTLVNRS